MTAKLTIVFKKALILMCWIISYTVLGQTTPVNITTQLVAPYSVNLSDYATVSNEKLKVIIVQRDLSKATYQLRLRMSVSLNGQTIMVTSNQFNPPPITVQAGIPVEISGIELQSYLDTRNIDFVGYSREEYERTKSLPEGSYEICFTALDYNRQTVQVSNDGCSSYWLSKSDPPLVNMPSCGSQIQAKLPQQVVFSWLPRHITSPNSAQNTEYIFSLYEIRQAGRNPNDVVLSTNPIFERTTNLTQFVYGPAEPQLIEGMQYAWRVKAGDISGRDLFTNSGFTEVCMFTYIGSDGEIIEVNNVEDLEATGKSERSGKISWSQNGSDSYRIQYKKRKGDHKWFTKDKEGSELEIFDLEPNTEYEVRIQGNVSNVFGPYSDIVKFKTLEPRAYTCGEELPEVELDTPPLPFAQPGTIINVQDLYITLSEVRGKGEPGWFEGGGEVTIPYLGGATFKATFDRLYIDINRNATKGRIDIATQKVEEWIEESLILQAKEELEELQEANREAWSGIEFHEEVFYYDDFEIEDVKPLPNGDIQVTTSTGETYVNTDIKAVLLNAPEKGVIIEDKNGDQWVIQSGGKVTKVAGGGLSPYEIEVSEEAVNWIVNALVSLRNHYSDDVLADLKTQVETKYEAVSQYKESNNTNSPIDFEDTVIDELEGEEIVFEIDLGEHDLYQRNEYDELASDYKQVEKEYNIAQALVFLSQESYIDQTANVIAIELRIEGTSVSEYVEKERDNLSDTELLEIISENIKRVIGKALIEDSQTPLTSFQ